jgi:serine/threonine protein phosphatase PrpC
MMTRQLAENRVASAQIRGARDYQEDSLAVQRLAGDTPVHANELLLVLADGMGGHAGGEVASRLAVDCFCSAYRNDPKVLPEALRSSLHAANECIADAVLDAPELSGMGSTLLGCVVREDMLSWVSVGDSPLWVCRDSALQRLNADHSMVPLLELMVGSGELTREEMLTDPRRNLLRSALTGRTVELVDLCNESFRLETGDILMLASDGVETLSDSELAAMLQEGDTVTADELAGRVMAGIRSVARSDQDNASVILYRH